MEKEWLAYLFLRCLQTSVKGQMHLVLRRGRDQVASGAEIGSANISSGTTIIILYILEGVGAVVFQRNRICGAKIA